MKTSQLHSYRTFYCILAIVTFGILSSENTMGGHLITPFTANFCGGSYPTEYVNISFTLEETTFEGFTKNQIDKTLLLSLPLGFEFNTKAGSISFDLGKDIQSVTIQSLTANQMTVLITILNSKKNLDIIHFNDFQIRSTSAGKGTLVRTGGTFDIDGSVLNPTAPIGMMQTSAPMSWMATSTVLQTETSDVNSGSLKEEVIGIVINGTGACTPLEIQRFCFNTDGNNGTGTVNPASNISKAQVWFSGPSTIFADATTLFGEVSAPAGTFKINGNPSIQLSAGSNYFWVTYDIALGALDGDRVDARLDSVVVSGSLKKGEGVNFVELNPVGSRKIVAPSIFFSNMSGNWGSNIWSYTDGGPTCNCFPTSGIVYISHPVTIINDQTAQTVIIRNGGILTLSKTNKNLTVSNSLSTEGTGYFTVSMGILSVNGNLSLVGSGASNLGKDLALNGSLSIGTGSSLTLKGGNLTVLGNALIHGSLELGSNSFILDGSSSNFDGSGQIFGTGAISVTSGDKIISSKSNLIINASIHITGAYSIYNFGTVSIDGNIIGTNTSSQWKNENNANLTISGNLLNIGTLDATAPNNTITFAGTTPLNIKSGDYWNLVFKNPTVNTLTGNITILGNLAIMPLTTLDVSLSNHTLTLAGNWTNSGYFNPRNGKVIFNGVSILTSVNKPEIFNELMVGSGMKLTVSAGEAVTVLSSTVNYGTIELKSPLNDGPSASWIDNGTSAGKGNFTVERFVSGGRWWYIAPPVTGINSAVFNPVSGNNSLFWYCEPTGWSTIKDNTIPVKELLGYSFKSIDGDETLIFNGIVNTGSLNYATTRTKGAPKPGWQLVCNPYPSAIDWDAPTGWTKTNLESIFWIRKDGVYASYNSLTGIGTNGGTKEIAAMQAIWINDTVGNGSIGMTNSIRLHSLGTALKSHHSVENLLRIKVESKGKWDETVLFFSQGAFSGLEKMDTEKSFEPQENPLIFSSLSEGTKMTVNALNSNDLKKETFIPLHFSANSNADYRISISGIGSFDSNTNIYLKDDLENVTVNLKEDNAYNFYCKKGEYDRFSIVFTATKMDFEQVYYTTDSMNIVFFSVVMNGSGASLEWATSVELNNNFFVVERSLDGSDFQALTTMKGSGASKSVTEYSYMDNEVPSGTVYYRLKHVDNNENYDYSDIVSLINMSDGQPCVLNISPNPCLSQCQIYFESCEGEEDKDVAFTIYDALGNAVYSSVPKTIQEGKASFSFDPQNFLKPAIYVVRGSGTFSHVKDTKVIINK